jgi:hypothetical protein
VAEVDYFDGSMVALRKFTSSELLDAGFNISMVARRQGHGPHVLVKHYARGRPSADRKAAEHLGAARGMKSRDRWLHQRSVTVGHTNGSLWRQR